MSCAWTGQAQAQVLRIPKAHLWVADGVGAPTEVKLPHKADRVLGQRAGVLQYEMHLPGLCVRNAHALYIPRVGNQVEIWFNGERVFQRTDDDGSLDVAKTPLLIPLPATLLDPDAQTLRIRIAAQPSRWGGLSGVMFGPLDRVEPVYRVRYLWRQYGALAAAVTMGLAGLIAVGLWWTQRERIYGIFAIGALCGALRFGDRLLVDPPLGWPLWGALMAFALVGYLLGMIRFILELLPYPRHRIGRLLAGLLLVELVLIAVSFATHRPVVWTVGLFLTIPPALWAMGLLVRAGRRLRSVRHLSIGMAAGVVMVAGLRDLFGVRLDPAGFEAFSILPHASVLFALTLGASVVSRYGAHARHRQQLLATLDQRVQARERELGEVNERLQAEHARQATLVERQRIMRDIHDGVGSQLVGLLSTLDKGEAQTDRLREQAKAALDELRMVVDAMQPMHGDVATVLATLRYRLQPRMEQAGIAVDWRVEELPVWDGLTLEAVLQLQRIILEAFTNVLQHAGATRLKVECRRVEGTEPALVLLIEDDGRGMGSAEGQARGHGLDNMRARARAIGAELSLGSGPAGGTAVRLVLPIRQPASPPR